MPAEQQSTPFKGRLLRAFRERRFAMLLVFLIVSLASPSVLFGLGFSGQWLDGLMSLLTLAAICSLCFEPRQRLFALIFGTPTLIFSLGGQAVSGAPGDFAQVLGQLCEVVFFFGAAGLVVQALFNRLSVSFDSVMGAACGYLFVGLGWAVCYSLIERFQPNSFQLSDSLVELGDRSQTLPHLLTYFSFVTLTTVGYGDVTPLSPAARTLAWMEAITGQFYLGVIVAGLVSMIVANNSRLKPE
jgi:voltage-gated potassium channel